MSETVNLLLGGGGAAKAESARKPSPFRRLTSLDLLLIDWAHVHYPRAFDAICDGLDDGEKVGAWLGSIVRAIVLADPERRRKAGIDPTTSGNPMWLFRAAERYPQDLMSLSRHIGSIRWSDMGYPRAWGELPGPQGWEQWLKDVELSSGPFFAAAEAIEHLEDDPQTPVEKPEPPAPAPRAFRQVSRAERKATAEPVQKVKTSVPAPSGMLF